jgi:branched-chain amino acid transport system permease protein
VTKSAILLSLLTQAATYAIFATGPGILLRQNGMVSFGHALFFGMPGYIIALFLQLGLMDIEGAIGVAILSVAIVAFLLGLLIVRLPGIAFGMITLAIGQMVFLTASRTRGVTGGVDGINIDMPNNLFGVATSVFLAPHLLFLVTWTTLVLIVGALTIGLHGRFGAITAAVRDNDERARFIGIRTLLPRAVIFALSAAITSVGGVLSALNTGFVSPESLTLSLSGVALMMVVVGGYKSLWGPALGAMVYFLARNLLGDLANHWMAIFGLALIAVVVFFPDGIAGGIHSVISRFSKKKQPRTVAILAERAEAANSEAPMLPVATKAQP